MNSDDGYGLAGCFLKFVLFTTSPLNHWRLKQGLAMTGPSFLTASTWVPCCNARSQQRFSVEELVWACLPCRQQRYLQYLRSGARVVRCIVNDRIIFGSSGNSKFRASMWLFLKSIKIPQTAGFSHGHGDWDSSLRMTSPYPMCAREFWGPNDSCASCAAKCQSWGGQMLRLKVSQDPLGWILAVFCIRKILDQEKVLWKNMVLLCIAGIAAWSLA